MTIFPLLLLIQEHASEGAEEAKGGLLSPSGGLMFWTLIIFLVLLVVLSRSAFKPMIAAVEAREKALEEAIASAKADREAAARLLAEHQAQLDNARGEAQKLIVEGRAVGEKIRAEMIEETRSQQQEMLERARREIESEKHALSPIFAVKQSTSPSPAQQGDREKSRRRVEPPDRGELPRVDTIDRDEPLMRDATIARNYAEALLELARRADDPRVGKAHPRCRERRAGRRPFTLPGVAEDQ